MLSRAVNKSRRWPLPASNFVFFNDHIFSIAWISAQQGDKWIYEMRGEMRNTSKFPNRNWIWQVFREWFATFFLDLFLSSPTRFVVCSAYVLFVSDLQSKKLSSCDWGWKAHCDWSEHNMNIQTLKRFASFSRAYESTPSRRSHVRSPLWIFVWLDIIASNLQVASMTSVCMELVFYQVLLARTMFSLLP